MVKGQKKNDIQVDKCGAWLQAHRTLFIHIVNEAMFAIDIVKFIRFQRQFSVFTHLEENKDIFSNLQRDGT